MRINFKYYGSLFVLLLLIATIAVNCAITVNDTDDWVKSIYDKYGIIISWLFFVPTLLFIPIMINEIVVKYRYKNDSEARSLTWNEKMIQLLNNSFSGIGYYELFVIFSFIALVSWLPDSIVDYIKDGGGYWKNVIVNVCSIFFLVWLRPARCREGRGKKFENRKVLFTGISNPSFSNKRFNLLTVIKPLEGFKNIERIVVLLSDSITYGFTNLNNKMGSEKNERLKQALSNYCDTINSLGIEDSFKLSSDSVVCEKIKNCLADVIRVYAKEFYGMSIQVDFTAPVDYNDFSKCNNECHDKLHHILKSKSYYDENIVINITPGTSVVASVMMLNAIKGDRLMVYVNQNTSELVCDETPNVSLIQIPEWIDDRTKNSEI
jgi:hypothetical protein